MDGYGPVYAVSYTHLDVYKRQLLTGQKFKVRAKGNLIVRKTSSLLSKKLKTLKKGSTYNIVRVSSNGKRGKLSTGGWITITNKYVERI